ncbi:alkylhydroperoxidase family enzyme [Nocardioides luteus]|uniref:4-carboxymuconolactone decarboxylase n=1 Tax=Nocardioides luteus TaxID=1844 RepID=A0ABQ5SV62_9ACTN|nr:carboxymuconolactone decarboxylase family protein [Nocardioides luteus]MDR7311867.1 alkylhydroperoxidase family enzyme [Nocardioides luteus]GGR66890.1 4-carboxymuconolactone decarboxylase [Nocardioides luteus]GLJ68110.1 4-carboxymuconolactone decarboxylase [Nocardioides luteus]
MTEPRIRPGRLGEVGFLAWSIARLGGRTAGTEPLNLFLVLGRHKRLFRGWLFFAGLLMPGGLLPRQESELVILRVAHVRGSAYEETHHRRIGRRAGLIQTDLDRIALGPDADGWTPRRRAILSAVDELLASRDIGDPTWAALREHLDEREAIELVLLIGHYDMLAAAIAALDVRREGPRRGR